jgi:hypothetical protein
MSRKLIEQEVYYKSFRFTSKDNLLYEFLDSLDNRNSFIKSIILGSTRYKNYLNKNKEIYNNIIGGSFNG